MNKNIFLNRLILLPFFILVIGNISFGQDRFVQLENKLKSMVVDVPALDQPVDVSVNGVSIQEFIRGIANNVNLNISVDPALRIEIINNFNQVKVIDILIFLSKEYDLEIETFGSILSVSKFKLPIIELPKPEPKIPIIKYEKDIDFLTLELFNDTLSSVTKLITNLSGKNIILSPGIGSQIVNAYIQKMPFDNVLEKFAYANNFIIQKTPDNFYLIEKISEQTDNNNTTENIKLSQNKSLKNKNTFKNKESKKNSTNYIFDVKSKDSISISGEKIPIYDIIMSISDELNCNYFMISSIDGETSLNIQNINYDDFLTQILDGTNYTFVKQNNSYIIGESKNQALITSKILELQYRTVEKIIEFIPADIKKEVEIIEMKELNSIIITGTYIKINEIERFIRSIDKIVPVILIELLIVDVTKTYSFSTGLSAGIQQTSSTANANSTTISTSNTNVSTSNENSQNSIFPAIDYKLSTKAINDLISGINGFGWIKLGKVNSNFYMSLKAMEDNGVVRIKSTPKLSTLNGHEATLSNGETRYYRERRSNFIGTQNPTLSEAYEWKPLNADLSVNIKPIVSGDEQITLEIEVTQSEFTSKEGDDAPYNSVNRNFKSLIRVRDQEMVLLGGLDRLKTVNTGTGLPFLSRIPILKWIFSSRSKSKSDGKLNIFIKPTIIY